MRKRMLYMMNKNRQYSPTETFLNLSSEKQERIYQALFKEYIRVALEEVSVKNIIIDAEIPRGSFYHYFKDKEGALIALITYTQKESQAYLIELMKDKDLFELVEIIFIREMEGLNHQQSSKRLALLKQIVRSSQATTLFYQVMFEEMLNNTIMQQCFQNTFQKEDTLLRKNAFDLIVATLKDSLIIGIENAEDSEACLADFRVKLAIIKAGCKALS